MHLIRTSARTDRPEFARISLEDWEFHYKGEDKGIHKGWSNTEDQKAAADYAKAIIG